MRGSPGLAGGVGWGINIITSVPVRGDLLAEEKGPGNSGKGGWKDVATSQGKQRWLSPEGAGLALAPEAPSASFLNAPWPPEQNTTNVGCFVAAPCLP